MRKLLVTLAIVVLTAFLLRAKLQEWFAPENPFDAAVRRVAAVLGYMATDPPNESGAIARWATGGRSFSADDLRKFDVPFERFWRSSGLARGSGWRIVDAQFGLAGATLVTVSDGTTTITLGVVADQPIQVAIPSS